VSGTKIFAAIVLGVFGLAGLAMTACGVIFTVELLHSDWTDNGWLLPVAVGIVPGLVSLTIAYLAYKSLNTKKKNETQR
jgi:mannose/fructose/N-acetylgalactosamine-specific phosphotransferase system component IID